MDSLIGLETKDEEILRLRIARDYLGLNAHEQFPVYGYEDKSATHWLWVLFGGHKDYHDFVHDLRKNLLNALHRELDELQRTKERINILEYALQLYNE